MNGRRVLIEPNIEREVTVLKELTWYYVIDHPSLATQQQGQRKVIETLFQTYCDAAKPNSPTAALLPIGYRDSIGAERVAPPARVAADIVASMTEQQALGMYGRLTGTSLGSVLTPIIH